MAPIPVPKTPVARTVPIPTLGLFLSSTPSSSDQSSLSSLTGFSFVRSGSKKGTGSGAEKTWTQLQTHRLQHELTLFIGRLLCALGAPDTVFQGILPALPQGRYGY